MLRAIEVGAILDLLFLDVYLPDMKGTDLAAAVRDAHPAPQPSVAFITSSTDHAIQAFSLGTVHYITKPFPRAGGEAALQRTARPHELRRGISVPEGNATRFVYLDEIAMCESSGHRVTVRVNDGGALSFRQALGALRRSLDARFIGVTRGVVVNADFIERMGSKSCVLKDGREVLLSRSNAKEIRKAYQDYLFSRMVDRLDR
ncbi:MAG: response regulator transcription factor [Eggerthellaceae bacterium]|nr:response regulator transcription factor [Eggerthellaceae bacterium]